MAVLSSRVADIARADIARLHFAMADTAATANRALAIILSFVPTGVAHFTNDPVGRMWTIANEPGRRNVEAVSADLVALPDVTQPADVFGCTCSVTISTPL